MSDMIDDFRALKEFRKQMRADLGIKCPKCAQARPRAHATILMPGQRCKVDGYRDLRPSSLMDEWKYEPGGRS
jgi:hypothetical protein